MTRVDVVVVLLHMNHIIIKIMCHTRAVVGPAVPRPTQLRAQAANQVGLLSAVYD